MIIPSRYKPLGDQTHIDISGADGWVKLDLSSLSKNPSAALITCGGVAQEMFLTYYDGVGDPGNDKKPFLWPNQYLFVEGFEQIKNLWFRNIGSSASIKLLYYTT